MAKSGRELLKIIERDRRIFSMPGFGGDMMKKMTKVGQDIKRLYEEYGFDSDHCQAFSEKYCGGGSVPVWDKEKITEILQKVTDYKDVGTLYVSLWRDTTHFSDEDPFGKENSKQFIPILDRLLEIVVKKS